MGCSLNSEALNYLAAPDVETCCEFEAQAQSSAREHSIPSVVPLHAASNAASHATRSDNSLNV